MTTISTELAVYSPMSPADKLQYCEKLAQSGLLPKEYRAQPANVLYAIEYGEMLGIPALAAINGVHVIDGKPTASAALISALVRKAGHRMRSGYDAATLTGWAEIVRADDPEYTFRSEWNLARAVDAELCTIKDGKPFAVDRNGKSLPWRKFFPSMVKARATTEVARDASEEVLFGLHYTPDELGALVDEDGVPDTRVRVETNWADTAPPPAAPEPPHADREQLTTLADLVEMKYGPDGRARVLEIAAGMVGRRLGSAWDLLATEADELAGALRRMPDHIADAVVVEDPASGAPDQSEALAALERKKLLQRIAILVSEKRGTLERPARLAFLSGIAGRPLTSSGDLSLVEMHAVVAKLQAMPSRPMATPEPGPGPAPEPDRSGVAAALGNPTPEQQARHDELFADLVSGIEGTASRTELAAVWAQVEAAVAEARLSQADFAALGEVATEHVGKQSGTRPDADASWSARLAEQRGMGALTAPAEPVGASA